MSHLVRLTVAGKPYVLHSNSPVPDPGSLQSVPKQTESEVAFTQSSRRNGNRDRYSALFSDARWPHTTLKKVVDFLLCRLCTACFVSVQWRLSSNSDPVSESGSDPPLVEHRREQLSASAPLSKRAPFGLVWMSLTSRQRTWASNWACFYFSCSAAGLPLKLCGLHWAAVPGPIQIPNFESNPGTVISHIKAAQWFIISEDFIFYFLFFVCFSDCCLPLKYRYLKTQYVTFLDWNI